MLLKKDITIYDLADKLQISPATVSRGLKDHPAINKTTKQKIFALAEEMGYRSNHFARNLRQQKTHTIGVIVPRLDSHFTSTVLAGMEDVATKAGYNLLISQSLESKLKEEANAKTMFNNRVDGLLISLAYDSDDVKHFDIFSDKKVPLVFFDRVSDDQNYTNVVIDNRKAAYAATAHLINGGCTRIIHLTAASKRNVYVDRLAGYKDALRKYKIKFDKRYVIKGNLSIEAGTEAAEIIAGLSPLPDAVFAANDAAAVGCMITLRKLGINVPQEIAIVGFNNDPISNVVNPNLTTINYPGYEVGQAAAAKLIEQLNRVGTDVASQTIVLPSELIIRESSIRKSKSSLKTQIDKRTIAKT